MEMLDQDPPTLFVYTENDPDPETDAIFGTTATLAVGETRKGWLEVAVRQNLRYEWREKCHEYNLHIPCCYVFHARYLN